MADRRKKKRKRSASVSEPVPDDVPAQEQAGPSRVNEPIADDPGLAGAEEPFDGVHDAGEDLDISEVNEAIKIPPSDVPYGDVNLHSVSGEIHVGSIAVDGKVDIEAVSGDVTTNLLDGCTGVHIHTTNGSIHLRKTEAPGFDLHTVNGKITGKFAVLPSDGDDVYVKTINGSVEIKGLEIVNDDPVLDKNIEIETVNGDVKLVILGFGGEYEISSTNGKITIQGNVQPLDGGEGNETNPSKTHRGISDGYLGNHSLKVQTVSGNISVKFL